jgi:hypothetical protein
MADVRKGPHERITDEARNVEAVQDKILLNSSAEVIYIGAGGGSVQVLTCAVG